eukprot:70123-Chlamydomonas_euryale.AAC.1
MQLWGGGSRRRSDSMQPWGRGLRRRRCSHAFCCQTTTRAVLSRVGCCAAFVATQSAHAGYERIKEANVAELARLQQDMRSDLQHMLQVRVPAKARCARIEPGLAPSSRALPTPRPAPRLGECWRRWH